MNPIYNEYITFLRDKTGETLPYLKEGYFWLDRQIIKCFDKQGNEHKIARIKVEDDLELIFCTPKTGYDKLEDIEIASWNDIIELQKEHLEQLETCSLNVIKAKHEKFAEYESIIPVSTGKDSMLTSYLVRKIYPNTHAVFNNTSLDTADTYRMAKAFPNCEIMNPKKGFYQYVTSDHMIPTRFARFCCRIFKVGVMVSQLDHNKPYLMWMGMRNEESATRSGYEDEWVNTAEWGDTCWQGILPIRKWTELDVWLYTIWKGLDINPKYKKGYSRCGCHCACPYYTKTTWVLDQYWYPKAYDRWRNILKEDFIENKKWIIMNCTIKEYIQSAWNGGTYRDEPTQEVIDEFAEYNGLNVGDTAVAKQYFNKSCCDCGKRIKSKEVLAMNMKFHGREITKFLCKKCFKKLYEMDDAGWDRYVASFKRSGCALFDKQEEK